MKKVMFSIAAVAMSIHLFAQAKEKKVKDKILANQTYSVEITETSAKKAKPKPDEISFKSEKVSSKSLTAESHFTPMPYTVVSVDTSSVERTVMFEAVGKSGDEDVKWEGTITGDAIEGKIQTTKKGKTKHEYSFTGTVVEKKKKK